MEIFIATSIKSFDVNPTHPGPLPSASFHTSANQQIEHSESKAARGRARRATDEVSDRLQQRPRRIDKRQAIGCKAESSCEFLRARGQETTPAEKGLMRQPQWLGDDFEFAFN